MFYKKAVLKNFTIFTGNHPRWSLFWIKLRVILLKEIKRDRCFPVNFAPFLQNTSARLVWVLVKLKIKVSNEFFKTHDDRSYLKKSEHFKKTIEKGWCIFQKQNIEPGMKTKHLKANKIKVYLNRMKYWLVVLVKK